MANADFPFWLKSVLFTWQRYKNDGLFETAMRGHMVYRYVIAFTEIRGCVRLNYGSSHRNPSWV